MKTLGWLLTLSILDGAVSAGAADGTAPSRPVFSREAGLAPPARIPAVIGESPEPQGTSVPTAEVPKSVRRAVAADAARRFRVDESAVVLASAVQVTWGDGSLGCPEPGVRYTQNPVPGYVIVAKTAAGELRYHTDSREQARSCGTLRPRPNRQSPTPTPTPGPAPPRATQPPADR